MRLRAMGHRLAMEGNGLPKKRRAVPVVTSSFSPDYTADDVMIGNRRWRRWSASAATLRFRASVSTCSALPLHGWRSCTKG